MTKNIKQKIITTLLFITLISVNISVIARDSPFTRKGTGPKYWIAYEYCWITNMPIPEDRWKANIDWMNTHFKSFGYDMICNDGWIEAAQTIDNNGYITKYNDQWEHSFKYWAEYLDERGMKLGVYYNPMWMTKAAYDKNVSVKGTDIKAQDITGPISFNEPLYWIDTDRKGAKEWIQGYVKYFIETGATYLRIDFLENYEKNYGTAKYIQALEWIKEAAGNDIFLSLVMPNCFDHGRNELKYGDMIRIDDDCFDGGWEFVSDRRRGQQKAIWPQYGNAFDGFIGFADIGGRGQMILDGDFMRMNTMANDNEQMFMFSLMVMGGSALTIADQYDSIGEHAWVYQNTELLELNNQGFVAKPLSYDPKNTDKSSVWAGQLPNGDWVVGLFNRESTKQVRSIDFDKELGIERGSTENVRDLWAHKDLGSMLGGYSVELAPHECKIIKIKNNSLRYEAEFASMINTKKKQDNFRYNGCGYAGDFQNTDAKVFFAIEIPDKGNYTIQIRYANPGKDTGTASLYINDKKMANQMSFAPVKANQWELAEVKVSLEAGNNFISIQKDNSDNGYLDLDYIQIIK